MTIWWLLNAFALLVLVYFVVLNASYLVTSVGAFRSLRKHALRLESVHLEGMLRSRTAPPITVIAPAFNEAETCVEATRALLALEYPHFEIVIVNDGSTDATLERLRTAYELEPASRFPTAHLSSEPVRGVWRSRIHPALWLVDKENGGKASALNTGIDYTRTPLFCAMDADSVLERDALARLARAFMEDASLIAAGGIIRVANGCLIRDGRVEEVRLPRNLLARFQVLEYLRAFFAGRMGWDALGATLVISGAFGMFRRSAVVEVGGYRTDTVGEDMEVTIRLHRHFREAGRPYRIGYVPDPVVWTEAPETLRVLGRQRDRWQRGLAESLGAHVRMLLNPRYGRIGLVAFPYFFFLEMLGPLVEAGGWIYFAFTVPMGHASLPFAAAFLALAVMFGMAISVSAVALEELTFRRYARRRDLLQLFALGLAENVGYRQLQTWWRFQGMVSVLRRVDTWGEMERRGFGGDVDAIPGEDEAEAEEEGLHPVDHA